MSGVRAHGYSFVCSAAKPNAVFAGWQTMTSSLAIVMSYLHEIPALPWWPHDLGIVGNCHPPTPINASADRRHIWQILSLDRRLHGRPPLRYAAVAVNSVVLPCLRSLRMLSAPANAALTQMTAAGPIPARSSARSGP